MKKGVISRYFKFDGINVRMRLLPRLFPWLYKKNFHTTQFARWLELRCGEVRWEMNNTLIVLTNGVNIDDAVAERLTGGSIAQNMAVYTGMQTLGVVEYEDEVIFQEGRI